MLWRHYESGWWRNYVRQTDTGPGGVPESEFFGGLSLTAAGGTGALDPGINGVADGGPQFQIVFDAIGAGTTTFDIGTFGPTDVYTNSVGVGDNSTVVNTSLTVTVIPEPGTALLMGLGLAGLAGAGRRE